LVLREKDEIPLTSPARAMRASWTWGLSLVLHAAMFGGVGWVAYRTLQAREVEAIQKSLQAQDRAAGDIELPSFADGIIAVDREPDPIGVPPVINGGSPVARMDTGTAGAGGDDKVREQALNLSDGDERLRLSPDTMSHLDHDQINRLRVSKKRESWEDRRATKNPMELTFLATGPGELQARRDLATSNPSRGALSARKASMQGGESLGRERPDGEGDPRAPRGSDRLGSRSSAPGLGLTESKPGTDHRTGAVITTARPDVTQGPVAVPANERARPKDNTEADQEVAVTLRSLVHASTAGGNPGDGRGGTQGPGDPGAGASNGNGSQSRALGQGDGDTFDINTRDPRLMMYFRHLQAKIHPLWADAFPKSAALEHKQGTVILEFVVTADGSATVAWPPLRPSGVDEFDLNCANAIRRAAPFQPIPRELGRSYLRVRAPFTATNPIVR
jgi:TonB family protein